MVYCGGLENRFGFTADGGSNPSLSATVKYARLDLDYNLGGRNWRCLRLAMAGRTFGPFHYLRPANPGGTEEMYLAYLGGIERFDGGGGDFNSAAWRVHRGSGPGVLVVGYGF